MTIASNGLDTTHDRRVEQVRQECQNNSIDLVNVQNVTLKEVNALKISAGSTITSLVGGKAEYDFLQIYTLKSNNLVHYYFQPFSGHTPLPGEHFILLPIVLKSPVQYRIKRKKSFTESIYETLMDSIPFVSSKKIRICEWLCADTQIQNNLRGLKLPVIKELSNVWLNGLTKIELEWTVQASAINEKYTIISMKTGRYGALGERTGLKQFRDIYSYFMSFAGNNSGDGSNNVMITNSYLGSIFIRDYVNTAQDNERLAYTANHLVKSIISNMVSFYTYKRVYLNEKIDDKMLKNLQESILTKFGISKEEIVAAVALDPLGRMKQAAVFTKDKLYISDTDYEDTLNLKDVYANNGLKGALDSSLDLVLLSGEVKKLQVSLASDFMNDFFNELCNCIESKIFS